MATNRKLGRATNQRKAMLRNLATSFFKTGKIITTQARAKEVQSIIENLIATAIGEVDNFTTRTVKVSSAKKSSSGRLLTVTKTSKNGNKYEKAEREMKSELVTVDSPSRLNARRKILKVIFSGKDENKEDLNLVNKIFDEIAPKFKGRSGGYTRIYKLGPRRGDAAELVILELVG